MKRRALVYIVSIISTILIIAFLAFAVLRIGDSDAGASPSGERLERIKQSPNYDGKKFVNIEPTEVIVNSNYWDLIKAHFSDRKKRKPARNLPTEKPDFDKFTSDDKIKAIWLGHATVLISIDKLTLLTDPVFDNDLSVVVASTQRFQPPVVSREKLPKIDVVIISHDHYDHLERSTIEFLSPTGAIFFVPLGIGAHLELWNVPDSQIVELDWWESRKIGPIEIVCTPARHFSGRTPLKFYETLWSSWAIIGKKHRVYFGGDTGFSNHFKKIGDKYGPFDLTILPIGAYDKSWPDIHIDPEQAVKAQFELKGKLLLPMHWGTFDVALHPWDEPIERFVAEAKKNQIGFVAPMMGELVTADSRFKENFWWRLKP